jgi:histidine ammonia-lyase
MATHAARKARTVVGHVATVLGIELMAAAQAIDMLRPLTAGAGVEAAHAETRRSVKRLGRDRVLAGDIGRASRLIAEGELRRATEAVVGRIR